jgi:hypothetical protein
VPTAVANRPIISNNISEKQFLLSKYNGITANRAVYIQSSLLVKVMLISEVTANGG